MCFRKIGMKVITLTLLNEEWKGEERDYKHVTASLTVMRFGYYSYTQKQEVKKVSL